MTLDSAEYYRGLSAGYADAIRASDSKANVAMLFLSIVMGPVIGSHEKYPHFLTLPILISPFLVAFLFLFFAILPRYPRREAANLLVSRTASPQDFQFVDDRRHEILEDQHRCAILSHILFWKTRCLQVTFFICLLSVLVATVLIVCYGG
jgi:hypothetical protein